jgi:hypothetical protein
MPIEELERAHVMAKQQRSDVEFRGDARRRQIQMVTLVYPERGWHIATQHLRSGAWHALSAVLEDHSIAWETYIADLRRLTVFQVARASSSETCTRPDLSLPPVREQHDTIRQGRARTKYFRPPGRIGVFAILDRGEKTFRHVVILFMHREMIRRGRPSG